MTRGEQLGLRKSLKEDSATTSGRGGRGRGGRGRGRGGRGRGAQTYDGPTDEEIWQEYLAFKAEQDGAAWGADWAAEEDEEEEEEHEKPKKRAKSAAKSKAKAKARSKAKAKAKSKSKRSHETVANEAANKKPCVAADVVEDMDAKATFARRYKPEKRAFAGARWEALKAAFTSYILPAVDKPSSYEEWFAKNGSPHKIYVCSNP